MKEKLKEYQSIIKNRLLLMCTKIFIFLNDKNNIINLWIIKNKKKLFIITLSSLTILSTFCMGYSIANNKYNKMYNEKFFLQIKEDSILKSNFLLETQLKELLSSKQYLQHRILIETGLRVPDSVPMQDLQDMYTEAEENDIPPRIFFRLIRYESVFNPNDVNKHSRAEGYTQLMPDIVREYSKKFNLKKSRKNNLKIGAIYLKELYLFWDRYNFSETKKWELALASYTAGINAVFPHKAVPNRSSVKHYIKYILD